jgi:hypothetical protein
MKDQNFIQLGTFVDKSNASKNFAPRVSAFPTNSYINRCIQDNINPFQPGGKVHRLHRKRHGFLDWLKDVCGQR